jgi:bacteriocin-like protein
MMTLRKEGAKWENKIYQTFEVLTEAELNSILGGDQQNTEKDDGDK